MQAIVDAILALLQEIPEAKEMGLAQVGRAAGSGGLQGMPAMACRAPALPPAPAPPLPLSLPLRPSLLLCYCPTEDDAAGVPCPALSVWLICVLSPPPPPLLQLCEFIEDCEFTFLSVQILHLLGEEGPKTKDPGGCWGWGWGWGWWYGGGCCGL